MPFQHARVFSTLYGLILCGLFAAFTGSAIAASSQLPQKAPIAAPFTLTDLSGKQHSLSDYKGHPLAVFFFCGCVPCHACAKEWVTFSSVERPVPQALVVFSGDARSASEFAQATGLKLPQNTVLLDPTDDVSTKYGVITCPRVFVLDRTGHVRYTNDEKGSNPQTTPAVLIVSHTISHLRSLTTTPG